MQTILHLIGYASSSGGVDQQVANGPLCIQQSTYLNELIKQGYPIQWDAMVKQASSASSALSTLEQVRQVCEQLAFVVADAIKNQKKFVVIGGDHTCAIGTWSAVCAAKHKQGEIGLIWIDAHMDSHTPNTSLSGRIHGMPLACLLGYGDPSLTSLLSPTPKFQAQNICLIGVRSYEHPEAALLKKLNVKIYYMDEVRERGFVNVLNDAVKLVSAHTVGYGISLDLDGIDPLEAPAVDVPEANGIHVNELFEGLTNMTRDEKLIATEIVEFDPSRDKNQMTEKLVVSLLKIFHEKNDEK